MDGILAALQLLTKVFEACKAFLDVWKARAGIEEQAKVPRPRHLKK